MSDENKDNKMNRRDMMKAMGLTAGAVGFNTAGMVGAGGHEQSPPPNPTPAPPASSSIEQGNGQPMAMPPVDTGEFLTNDQGVRISDDQNTLRVGARGPGLLEDFLFREKMTRFDHERIPERVVHARGVGIHGFFQVYKACSKNKISKGLC
ncbi:MAG: catalase [Caldilineaceae bacterium]